MQYTIIVLIHILVVAFGQNSLLVSMDHSVAMDIRPGSSSVSHEGLTRKWHESQTRNVTSNTIW